MAIAACLFPDVYPWGDTYEKLSFIYWQFERYGKYVTSLDPDLEENIEGAEIDCLVAGGGRECWGNQNFRRNLPTSNWDMFEKNAQSLATFLYFG